MRILFVGDVVGRSGRTVLHERLPRLIGIWMLDVVVVYGENGRALAEGGRQGLADGDAAVLEGAEDVGAMVR